MEAYDKDALNKLIIQMLLQSAVGDKSTRADPDINQNYSKGFGLLPPPPTEFSPKYQQPFRQRPPQMENWWQGVKS